MEWCAQTYKYSFTYYSVCMSCACLCAPRSLSKHTVWHGMCICLVPSGRAGAEAEEQKVKGSERIHKAAEAAEKE
eukprot:scaffold10959_cov24-Tisochrysis_lutea.AAC.1